MRFVTMPTERGEIPINAGQVAYIVPIGEGAACFLVFGAVPGGFHRLRVDLAPDAAAARLQGEPSGLQGEPSGLQGEPSGLQGGEIPAPADSDARAMGRAHEKGAATEAAAPVARSRDKGRRP